LISFDTLQPSDCGLPARLVLGEKKGQSEVRSRTDQIAEDAFQTVLKPRLNPIRKLPVEVQKARCLDVASLAVNHFAVAEKDSRILTLAKNVAQALYERVVSVSGTCAPSLRVTDSKRASPRMLRKGRRRQTASPL